LEQSSEWLKRLMARCRPGLFQALIQFASGSLTGLDCTTLVILLRQHLSLNEHLAVTQPTTPAR
jgi:hypothetical protein